MRLVGKVKFFNMEKRFGLVQELDLNERFFHGSEWRSFTETSKGVFVRFDLKPVRAAGKADEAGDIRGASGGEILAFGIELGKATVEGGAQSRTRL